MALDVRARTHCARTYGRRRGAVQDGTVLKADGRDVDQEQVQRRKQSCFCYLILLVLCLLMQNKVGAEELTTMPLLTTDRN